MNKKKSRFAIRLPRETLSLLRGVNQFFNLRPRRISLGLMSPLSVIIAAVFAVMIGVGVLGFGENARAAEYYMPDDCTNLHACFALMSSGDTLIIRDGVYTGDENVIYVNEAHRPPDGSEEAYTTIKAEHTGQVIFDGEGVRRMMRLRGWDYGSEACYIQLEGLVWRHSSQTLVDVSFADHIKFVRCGAYETTGSGYLKDAFRVGYCNFILFENCWSYGAANYNFLAQGNAKKVIFRRCVARHDRYSLYSSQSSFGVYGADDVEFQNCIAIDADQAEYCTGGDGAIYPPYTWMFRFMGTAYFRGCISLNNKASIGVAGSATGETTSILFQNSCVHWDSYQGSRMRDHGADFDHCNIGKIDPTLSLYEHTYFWGNGMAFETSTSSISNSVVYGVKEQAAIAGGNGLSDYNTLFGNDINYAGVSQGAHDYCSENSNAIDPINGIPGNGIPALKYLPKIEDGSNLDGTASDGGDRGATILTKIGVDGTLWGEPGYNTDTGESLWPFPNEDLIKEQMSQYYYDNATDELPPLTGDRGFCADGNGLYGGPITLTSYIWEYLGNPCPSEICAYGEDITPPSRSNPQPTGTLPSGTTQTTISLATNETAVCKYDTASGVTFDQQQFTFDTTGGTTHSQTITGLSDGDSKTYYIRCQDESNNQNTNDFTISFSIASSSATYSISNFINLVSNWLHSGSGLESDVNGDGVVNTRDLGIMMSNWGE